ncbi:MAG TPA: phytanoyl-CoA dioxygenase family protein [Chthonomonadaceae bacterium]|nr:phytanoyl-CoA dioxygenase family protein [Chthonomonadaceae bacterium]
MSNIALELPDLTSDYPLTEAQVAAFQKDGHILLRGVCSPEEIAAYRPVINAAAYRYNTQTRPMEERDTYGKAFLQIMNLWEVDEAVRRYVLARRFGKIAADLLRVPAVRLYHDQALYKEANGGHTPWHQDQYYWPLDTKGIQAVTLWMPSVDISVEMGALTFATGSHTEGFLGHLQISDESHEEFDQVVKERGYSVTNAAMQAGDATFHAGWLLHSAPGNLSDTTREVMTIIYFADGVRTFQPDNPNRQDDLERWLPGVQPGELASSKLNPVVYQR